MGARDDILDIARQHLGHDNLLTVPRSFIELTGDHFSALMLSQLLYWTERATDPEGWVYKSHAEWKEELGMGRSVVDRSRRRLVTLGLMQETYRKARGMRVMHFRLHLPALRVALLSLTAVPDICHAESRVPADRSVEGQQSAVSVSRSPFTETPAQTTLETPAETISQTISETCARKGVEELVAEMRGPERERAMEEGPGEEDGHECGPDVPHLNLSQLRELCRRQAREHRARESKGRAYEGRLFETLETLCGFPKDRDYAHLGAVLADYPGVDHIPEFGRFAEYWRDTTLARPWLALRKWLERASIGVPPGGADSQRRTFIWRTAPNGLCYTENIAGTASPPDAPSGACPASVLHGGRTPVPPSPG